MVTKSANVQIAFRVPRKIHEALAKKCEEIRRKHGLDVKVASLVRSIVIAAAESRKT